MIPLSILLLNLRPLLLTNRLKKISVSSLLISVIFPLSVILPGHCYQLPHLLLQNKPRNAGMNTLSENRTKMQVIKTSIVTDDWHGTREQGPAASTTIRRKSSMLDLLKSINIKAKNKSLL